jgi:Arc/MetJ family transcription regulator
LIGKEMTGRWYPQLQHDARATRETWNCAPDDATFDADGAETMKAAIAIDDELFAAAQEYAGDKKESAVISEALKAFVEREAARRLARMGGSAPDLVAPPRRRFGK